MGLIGSPHPVVPSLVGRERELATLRGALDAALAGRGSLMLIGGEAGIGKTALAEATLAGAAQWGALVLVGRCYDLSVTPPYGLWRELFDRAPRGDGLPALPMAVLPSESDGEALGGQDAIFRRVQRYLATLIGVRPAVFLLEDLHWADPASLDLLRIFGRFLADLPFLFLAT
jgi:predicted ATPase